MNKTFLFPKRQGQPHWQASPIAGLIVSAISADRAGHRFQPQTTTDANGQPQQTVTLSSSPTDKKDERSSSPRTPRKS